MESSLAELLDFLIAVVATMLRAGGAVIDFVLQSIVGLRIFLSKLLVSALRLGQEAWSFLRPLIGGVLDWLVSTPAGQLLLVLVFAGLAIGLLYGFVGIRGRGSLRTRSFHVPSFTSLRSRMALFLSAYLILIGVAEVLMLPENPTIALLFHFGAISVAIAAGTVIGDGDPTRYAFYAFPLIPIIRVANLTLPLELFSPLLQVVVINAVVLVGIATAIRSDPGIISGLTYFPSLSQAGEWIAGIGAAVPLGLMASQTVDFEPLISASGPASLLRLGLVMVLFVGLSEEILFRAFLQRWLGEIHGPLAGILVASATGAVMVYVWGSLLYLYFVLASGIFLGLLFHRTRNLPLAVISHGLIEFGIFSYPAIFG
jgi:hypothetical protein